MGRRQLEVAERRAGTDDGNRGLLKIPIPAHATRRVSRSWARTVLIAQSFKPPAHSIEKANSNRKGGVPAITGESVLIRMP